MDFAIPADLAPVLDKIERLLTEDVIPAEHEVLTRGFVAAAPVLDALRAKVKAAGLWADGTVVSRTGFERLAVSLKGVKWGEPDYSTEESPEQAERRGRLEVLERAS